MRKSKRKYFSFQFSCEIISKKLSEMETLLKDNEILNPFFFLLYLVSSWLLTWLERDSCVVVITNIYLF